MPLGGRAGSAGVTRPRDPLAGACADRVPRLHQGPRRRRRADPGQAQGQADDRVRATRRPAELRPAQRRADHAGRAAHPRHRQRPSDRLTADEPGRPGRVRASSSCSASCRSCRCRCCRSSTSSVSTRAASACPRRSTASSDAQKDTLLAESVDMTAPSGIAKAKAESEQLAAACAKKYGAALQYYNTENTARDMDQIRQAVGDSRMNYLGLLLRHRARLGLRAPVPEDGAGDRARRRRRPGHVRASRSRPSRAQGFEQAFGQFAANCRTVSPCDQLGDPAQAVRAGRPTARSRTRSRPRRTGS